MILTTTLVAMGLTLVGDLATLAETVVLLLLFVFLGANVLAVGVVLFLITRWGRRRSRTNTKTAHERNDHEHE